MIDCWQWKTPPTCCGIALMRYWANFCSWSRSSRDRDSDTGARRRTCPAYTPAHRTRYLLKSTQTTATRVLFNHRFYGVHHSRLGRITHTKSSGTTEAQFLQTGHLSHHQDNTVKAMKGTQGPMPSREDQQLDRICSWSSNKWLLRPFMPVFQCYWPTGELLQCW